MTVQSVASADDPRLCEYRWLTDPATLHRAGLFVAEGRFVVQRLLALDRYRVHSLLVTDAALRALKGILQARSPRLKPCPTVGQAFRAGDHGTLVGVPLYVVDQSLMNDIVGFNIHRGCLALAHRPAVRTIDDLALGSLARVVVLEGVNNPDNVGGLFRSAAAFGADVVILGPASGDPLYRKAIRTSMAATLQLPFVDAGTWPHALAALRDSGMRVLALSTGADAIPIERFHRAMGAPDAATDDSGRHRVAIVVGNEGHGLTAAALAACEERLRIEMTSAVDSLNVTVAASIAMHRLFAKRPGMEEKGPGPSVTS